jgi:hypothetical protein
VVAKGLRIEGIIISGLLSDDGHPYTIELATEKSLVFIATRNYRLRAGTLPGFEEVFAMKLDRAGVHNLRARL